MISKNHIFKILLVFILGIVFAKYTRIDWILAFTVWSFLLTSLLILVLFGRNNFSFRKVIGSGVILVFFSSGILGFSSSQVKHIDNHFYKLFLPNDNLIGRIVEFEEGLGSYNKVIFEVDFVANDYREKSAQGALLCYVNNDFQNLTLGDRLIITPKLLPIKNKNNPGEFDAENYWESQGITKMSFLNKESIRRIEKASFYSTFWFKSREYFKEVLSNFVGKENVGVATALVLGDKSMLTKEKRAVFANSGAMHVLAVSGMHVGILLGFLQFIFYRINFLRKRNLYIYFALIIVWCFAFLTGLSASVFRAVIMFSILAIGQLRGYSFFSLNALLFSCLILLIIDANYLFNIGFQLSFLAMLGIVFFYGRIRNIFTIKNKMIRYFWEGTAIGIAAQIGTLPISLYHFHQFPNYFILTNVGLLVLAGAALIGAILLFVFHAVPFINELIGGLVDLVFSTLNGFVSWISDLPFSVSTGFDPNWIHVFLLYMAIIGVLYYNAKKRLLHFRVAISFLFILSVGLIVEREMNKNLQEFVVFNNYNKTVALKEENRILCFYEETKKSQLAKTEFLVGGYGKKLGCKIYYQPLNLGTKVLFGEKLKVLTTKKGWDINYANQDLYLMNKSQIVKDPSYIMIGGSWNKYVPQDYVDISTVQSAFILRAE